MSDAWPLAGTKVVDLSSGLAGAYCTKLLADGGADVVKVEDPTGDPLRRESESGAPIAEGDDGAFFRFLSTSKDSVVASATSDRDVELVAAAGRRRRRRRVVERVRRSPTTRASRPARCTRRIPVLVVAAVSPFGLDGPWRDRPTTDFTRQALCGGHVQRGTPDRPAAVVRGSTGRLGRGHVRGHRGAGRAATRPRAAGVGDLVDVAALDALMFSQPLFPVTWYEIAGAAVPAGAVVAAAEPAPDAPMATSRCRRRPASSGSTSAR